MNLSAKSLDLVKKSDVLASFIYFFAKKTFAKQFVAGETAQQSVDRVKRLKQLGIGAILDYSGSHSAHAAREGGFLFRCVCVCVCVS